MSDLSTKATALLTMHDEFVVLPTAWDAWSARTLVDAGFAAITIGSHPRAESRGQEDGEGMTQMGVQFDPVIRGVVNAEPIGIILAAVFLTTSIAAFFPALYAAFLRPVNALRRIG